MGYQALYKVHGQVNGKRKYLGTVKGWTGTEALGKAKAKWAWCSTLELTHVGEAR